jgi:hypothetical protein
MPDNPYLPWPVFRRSVVAAFNRSLTQARLAQFLELLEADVLLAVSIIRSRSRSKRGAKQKDSP